MSNAKTKAKEKIANLCNFQIKSIDILHHREWGGNCIWFFFPMSPILTQLRTKTKSTLKKTETRYPTMKTLLHRLLQKAIVVRHHTWRGKFESWWHHSWLMGTCQCVCLFTNVTQPPVMNGPTTKGQCVARWQMAAKINIFSLPHVLTFPPSTSCCFTLFCSFSSRFLE